MAVLGRPERRSGRRRGRRRADLGEEGVPVPRRGRPPSSAPSLSRYQCQPIAKSATSAPAGKTWTKLSWVRPSSAQRSRSTRQFSVSCCTHSITSRRGGSHSTIVIGSPVCSPSSCVIEEGAGAARPAVAVVAADPARQAVGLGQRPPDVLDRIGPGAAELQALPPVVLAWSRRRAGCRGPRSCGVSGRSCPPSAGDLGVQCVQPPRPQVAVGLQPVVELPQRARVERVQPPLARRRGRTRPASRSTRRCRLIAGRLTGNRSASSPAATSPCASSATSSRRTGSASAASASTAHA